MMASRHLRRMMMERQWLRQVRCRWLDQIEREGKSYDTYDKEEEERMSLKDHDRMRPDPEMDARDEQFIQQWGKANGRWDIESFFPELREDAMRELENRLL